MQTQALIEKITSEVKNVKGVRGIVLGGSRARGTHRPSSDIDLGIYYHADGPLDLVALSRIATQLDDEHRAGVITEIGGWGPWINGGGWLKVDSRQVDFLYRDLVHVSSVIDDCLNGKIEIVYQPGHPHGFVTSIYLAEMAVCQPLWDPAGIISELKKKTRPYPAALQKALIQKFAWEIDFSLQVARKSIERADVTYAVGCGFRSVMCMLQVLFAINGEYWLNEKGALALADQFALKPALLRSRVEESFRLLTDQSHAIQNAIAGLDELSTDIHLLTPAL
ncbi:MAG TPA: nucleotidyltransferase domain-containing protein [Anaerolineales bacterium]|nr:nucleotidyltransferase domain-containing protein [Anaerolineales bacterium]